MRDEYTVSQGKDFELKLPTNTFNKLFFKPGDAETKKTDPLNFEFEDRQGKPQVIRLKKGQKLLLQDAHQQEMTILTDTMVNNMSKSKKKAIPSNNFERIKKEQKSHHRTKQHKVKEKKEEKQQIPDYFDCPLVPNPAVEIKTFVKPQSAADMDIQQQFDQSKNITELQQAKKVPKLKFFRTPYLTPITFVSKD